MGRVIKELRDLRYLKWTRSRNSSGTAGSFLKAQEIAGRKKIYYKLSNYDVEEGIVGCECLHEIVADRVLHILHVGHLEYTLIHAMVLIDGKELETYVCASEDFKKKNESKVALDVFFQMEKLPEESAFAFCRRMGWQKYIYEMLTIDYLIQNRDRHGANIEVLRNPVNRKLRLAPLFDHGLSFAFSCRDKKEVQAFDVLRERPVQCFVGGSNTEKNLEIIPASEMISLPAWSGELEEEIFADLGNIVSIEMEEKIREMLRKRWERYEIIRNQR